MRADLIAWSCASFLVLAGCTALLGDVEPTGGTGGGSTNDASATNGAGSQPSATTTGAGNSSAAGGASASGGAGASAGGSSSTGPACTDTTTSQNCGACGHDCLGGACNAGVCAAAVLVPGVNTGYIALDTKNVYYSTEQAIFSIPLGADSKTPPTLLVPSASAGDLAVFQNTVYWTDTMQSALLSIDITKAPQQGMVRFPNMSSFPTGVAVDPMGDVFVALPISDQEAGAGQIMELLGGGGPVPANMGGLNQPYRVAADAENVYWTANDMLGELYRTSVKPGAPTMQSPPMMVGNTGAIAMDAVSVYWITMPQDGSPTVILSIDKATFSKVVPISLNEQNAQSLAVDDQYVYWTAAGDCAAGNGAVRRASKTGAMDAVDIIPSIPCPTGLGVSDAAIYAISHGALYRLVK